MQTITQLIKAMQPFSAPLGGRALLVQSCDQGNVLDVVLTDAMGRRYEGKNAGPAFKMRPIAGFTHVDISTSVDTNVSFIVTDGDVDIQNGQLNTVVVNTPANAIPVNIAGGTVNVTATNVGINNTNANPVPVLDAYQAPVSVTWNSATALNTAQTINTQGYDTVIFTIAPSGTITAGAISFEVNDGTNWIPLKAPRSDSYLTDTTFALAGASLHSWQLPVAGYPSVRARLSTAIVGSGSAQCVAIASSAPDVSLVTVGLDPSQPLPAGTNALGTVGVTALPALPAGANAIGTVGVTALPALPAGANAIGTVGVTALPALPAGANTIGSVNIANALPAGTNNIGVVTDNTAEARALAGNTYGVAVIANAGASQYAQAQLWNPVGSGVNLYVQQVAGLLNSGSGSSAFMYLNTTQVATSGGNGLSKNGAAAAAKGQVRYGTQGAAPGTPAIGIVSLPGQGLANYPAADPVCIPPGYGLTLVYNVAATQMSALFEWYEK
ncbi:protein of unknown function [Burkholderia multivorans]